MKTCLVLTSLAALSLYSLTSAQDQKFPEFLRKADVTISENYTPFGNKPEFNKFGDDGSSCVLDANGVLTWIGNQGEVRLLTSLPDATPLFVTNTECLVWVNRFVGYETYPKRPEAQLRLYRSTPGSSIFTFQDVESFQGKEIIDTPQVTNTTGTLTFVSTTRRDDGDETILDPATGVKANFYDQCDLRFYRLTFDAGVQFVSLSSVPIEAVNNFEKNTSGPTVDALGYGSDGSMAVKVMKWDSSKTYISSWVNSTGNFQLVDANPGHASRSLSISNTRFVFEVTHGGAVTGFKEKRRSSTTGDILSTNDLTGSVTGKVLDIWNYSQFGANRYFYAVDATEKIIRSYKLDSTGITLERTATLAGSLKIPSATAVAAVNLPDGSALLKAEDSDAMIWLHSGSGRDGATTTSHYSAIPNSSQARALYVTNTQAVIWENADAAKNASGSIPAPIVKHYSRDTTTGALTASPIYLDGSALLNTPRSTPTADYWLITTAEKPNAATATLRTYALRDGTNLDTDRDGLLDAVEDNTGTYASKTSTGTDPYDADTDDDGVNDGDEVYALEIITDPALSWAAAKTAAEARGGWLATIADADEHNALVRKIGQRIFTSYWLGAADTEVTQIETATASGTITGNGTANATITASGLTGSPKTIPVPVIAADTPTAWAAKVRAALVADKDVAALFNISGSGSDIVLARKTRVTNDGTLNLALSKGTSTGITAAPFSVNTRASAARAPRTFRWVDFAPFTYTLFRAGEPNGIASLNALSLRNDFKWTDDPATEARSYVVEYPWSDPTSTDTDADDLADNEERTLGGNPNNPDTDSDGLSDGEEKAAGTSLVLVDTDGDTLTDYAERITHNTDPLKKDTDGDALEDDDEVSLGTNPKVTDTDKDGLLDGDEVKRGTNPKSKDTDSDGLSDDKEVLVHKTNPLKTDSDGDLISDFDEVAKGSNPNDKKDPKNIDTDKDGLKNFDELFVHNTNPNKADTDGDGINDNVEITNGGDPLNAESDTDGDGLKDKVETRTKFFMSATNTGTDPYDSDSDDDGLSDKVETGTGKFVSMSNTGTNPNAPDTDGDGLDDKEETTGIRKTNHIAPVFTSSPFLIDTDGDLVGDLDESNARPKTNPRDPSKYPTIGGIKPISSLHALPVPLGDAQQVKIKESFAPYGHRPDRDKVGEDGSGTVIDRNGVLIWTNKSGEALSIPNSSFAKTLHVSNTECLVYNNRFVDGWNYDSHVAQIVMHRRGETGGIISSTPLSINGTVLDTASVTPTTYGYMLVSGKRYLDGKESVQITQKTITGPVTVITEERQEVDKWDLLDLTLNIITWDGKRRTLAGGMYFIPKISGVNFSDNVVLGYGSDGSILFSMTTALEFLDRYDDLVPGTFLTKTSSIWVSATINQENARVLPNPNNVSPYNADITIPAIDTLAYMDNNRLIGQRFNRPLNRYEIVDYRQFFKGEATLIAALPLSAGENILPLAEHSMRGLSPYIYTINAAGTSLKLYRGDATIASLGGAVTLPFAVNKTAEFVRNPRDGSLLIKSLDGPLIWVPTATNGTSPAVTGLGAPRVIPNSAQGKPLFVTSKECVVWLNSDEPPLNGSLPPASISHFQIIADRLVPATIAPPMEGNYVASPTALSPDPDLEGWHLTTFEKDAPFSVLMRTYQLQLAGDADRDDDGISDYDELTGRFSNANPKVATDPMNSDSDGDGLSDGRELLPFVFVSTPLPWESARIAANTKGGKLAVLNSSGKQLRFQTMMKAAKASGKFWIGGHDKLKEGEFRWITNDGQATSSGPLVQSASSYENWQDQQPNNLPNNSDAMQVSSFADFKWAMAPESRLHGYVIEYPFSDPNKADGPGDADGDGLTDSDEVNVHKTNPNKTDTDGDGLGDFTEVAVLFSNPLTGFLSGASVTLARASYEGLLYSEKIGLLGKISVNMENNGTFTGTYEIYNGFKSSIKGTLNKNNGLLVANSFAAKPAIGATTIALQRDPQTRTNHLHVRVNNPTFGLLFAKARPAATGFKPVLSRFTLEAALSEEASGPTGTMVATGSIAANGGTTSLQLYNPDGTTASSSGKVLDGGVIALYAKSSGSPSTHVIANIKVNNVLNTKSNFDAQLRLFTKEYDQARTLEGSFYTAPKPLTLPISSFNATNTTNNAVFKWTGGELDKAYQVYSWRPAEISAPKTNYDKTVATFTTNTGLLKVDYTRSDKARKLYQTISTAYAVVNQRKNTVNGYYSRINWQGGSFSVNPNTQNEQVPPIPPPDAPIEVPGYVIEPIEPSSKSVGPDAITYSIAVKGSNNWKVTIPPTADWVSAEVVNNDGSVWADKLTGRDSATINIKILNNTASYAREAIITIGGLEHTITQSAGRVTSITPASMKAPSEGNNYTIKVTASGSWKLGVTAPWIKAYVINNNGYTSGPLEKNIEGQGNATINVTVAANSSLSERLSTIQVGSKDHTVTQAPIIEPGTVWSINPTVKEVGKDQETYNIRVTGTKNWTISIPSDSKWLSVKVVNDNGFVYAANPLLTGSGNATIYVTVAANVPVPPNINSSRREGTINIGGKTHTCKQSYRSIR